jgi:4-hydroxy-4-methyl-2-oxoglutarate aldolase
MIGRVGFGFHEEIQRPDSTLLRQLQGAAASGVTDALGRTGVMDLAIKPLAEGMYLCGPAVTVDLPAADNLMLYKALQLARPGDVLVVSIGGHMKNAVWGELMTNTAQALKLGGLVVDGVVRDGAANRKLGFPMFCRGTVPVSGEKDGPGFVNGLISCGGVPVRPGDVVIGDDDGVVVVPVEQVSAVIRSLDAQSRREAERLAEIAGGKPLPGWLDRVLQEKGLVADGRVAKVSE